MNRLITMSLAAALCSVTFGAAAEDTQPRQGMPAMKTMDMNPMGMKMMDANADGLISQDEFTKHHEAMWETMKTMDANGDGMISQSECKNHHESMWGKMKKDSKGNVSQKDMQIGMQSMHGDRMMPE